jgi:hypothetical protein
MTERYDSMRGGRLAARRERVGDRPGCYEVTFRRLADDILAHFLIVAATPEDATERARELAPGVEHFLADRIHDEAEHLAGGSLNDKDSRHPPAVYAALRQREIERDLAGVGRS